MPLYGRTFHETHGANSLIITCDIPDNTMACFIGTELFQTGRGDHLAEEHLEITKYEETGHGMKGFLYHFKPRYDLLFLSRQRI